MNYYSKEETAREKAKKYGTSSLQDVELLEIILGHGNGNTHEHEIAIDLLNHYSSIYQLIGEEYFNLKKNKGVSETKALQLNCIYEIVLRINQYHQEEFIQIKSSIDVYEHYHLFVRQFQKEMAYVLYLNLKNKIIKEELLSIGDDKTTIINNKSIVKNALQYSASKIILVHSHPSGDSSPSENDYLMTNQLKENLDFFSIKLIDHIVLGNLEYFSFSDGKKHIMTENDKK